MSRSWQVSSFGRLRRAPLLATCALVLASCAGIERASTSSDGTQGDLFSTNAAISADGRYVAFDSWSTNFVPGDVNVLDVFVKDFATGTTALVNTDSSGTQVGSGDSGDPVVSPDGRYVVFWSENQLDPADTNVHVDVYIKDRTTGTTRLVSSNSAGVVGDFRSGWTVDAAISADGRYVAFESLADNLVPGGQLFVDADVYVKDLSTGETTRVSTDSADSAGDRNSGLPAISADGRYVVYESFATNLVPGDTNGQRDVFLKDRTTGTTTRVSVGSDGAQGNGSSSTPAISADGRYIAFQSSATNLVPGQLTGVFVRDRVTGTTTWAGGGGSPSISADGRYVVFESFAVLVPEDTNDTADVYVRDRTTATTTRVSVAANGTEGNERSQDPEISADGSPIAFESFASNLVDSDTNRLADVFRAPSP